ncbi:MAG: T9SS type A sorting domain-containing protein [Bacteroidales bacterium]|nr:T9SS type A sorting domain-containing protein [Bacteroidales bacterium]
MKKIIILYACTVMMTGIQRLNAQTIINPGEASGTWLKKSSPYLIKGDINIPVGDTLTIQPGSTVRFEGLYTINVQGTLLAVGTEKDSILFTVSDTTGIKNRDKYGWNGIRFDRRPVKWDTLKFKMPKNEDVKKVVEDKIKNGRIDTTTRIKLAIKIEDIVNDTSLNDSMFFISQGSQLSYCRFEYATSEGKPQPYVFGGAIYIYRYSNLIISNCLFENNFAFAGGAIYCKEAAPVITHNRIISCSAQSSGGAMVFIHSGPIILNNTVVDNSSGYNGGAVLFYESSPYVVNNTFLRNNAENSGGAVYCEQKRGPSLNNGRFSPAEKAKFPRNAAFEKANLNSVLIRNSTSYYGRFINNVICQNKAATGGGIGLSATMPEFTNLTLSDNVADTAGGGIYCESAAPQLTNSIIYGNSNDQVFLMGKSRPSFRYCSVESDISGIKKDSTCKVSFDYSDNYSVAPKFKSPAGGDYALASASGCIDTGIPDTASLGLPTVDLLGKNRIVNGRIDLGAVEYTGDKSKRKSTEEEDNTELNDDGGDMFTCIFPNPAGESFSIVIHNNKYESVTVRIFAQSGQTVYIENFKTDKWFGKEINVTEFTRGIYIVMIYTGENLIYNGEIVIE